jgi:ABC-type transport system involved in multi-copper enzyme maturation permease subunit
LGNPFTFPEVWRTTAFFSSVFVFIPAVVVIMLVSNEYTFRTHRQNVIDGWSRSQFVTSKLLDVAMISLMITIIYAIVALVTGFANQTRLIHDTWSQSYYIGLFFLQTFAQLSIAFLMGFLIKKAFLALGLFLFYFILLENLIVLLLWRYKLIAADYMPLEISDMTIPPPAFTGKFDPVAYQQKLDAIPLHIGLTIILTAIIWGICYRINNRRDLK